MLSILISSDNSASRLGLTGQSESVGWQDAQVFGVFSMLDRRNFGVVVWERFKRKFDFDEWRIFCGEYEDMKNQRMKNEGKDSIKIFKLRSTMT